MARCNVCHRALTNPDHIAAGIGPKCATKRARGGLGGGQASYPAERYARIQRGVERLADLLAQANRYLGWARAEGTAEEVAEAERQHALIAHWYARARRMETWARQRVRMAA